MFISSSTYVCKGLDHHLLIAGLQHSQAAAGLQVGIRPAAMQDYWAIAEVHSQSFYPSANRFFAPWLRLDRVLALKVPLSLPCQSCFERLRNMNSSDMLRCPSECLTYVSDQGDSSRWAQTMSKRGSRANFHALWHTTLVQSAAGTLLLGPMTDQALMCRPSSNSYWQRAFG